MRGKPVRLRGKARVGAVARKAHVKEKLIKIGAKVASHGRYAAFQMAGAATQGDRVKRSVILRRLLGAVSKDEGTANGASGPRLRALILSLSKDETAASPPPQ